MTEPAAQRRALCLEIAVVLAVTYGLSAVTAILQLADAVLRDLSAQRIPLNPRRSYFGLIDFGLNAAWAAQLIAWGALALYLLWRSGYGPARVGLNRRPSRRDLAGGLGLAALIGLPGLVLYLLARTLGLNADVIPAAVTDTWWRAPMLIVIAFANGFAEEVIVVGYLLTRLSQLRVAPLVALTCSALLRGTYHLYQGFGAGLGNVAMGLVFGYAWQRTGRLWPLILAHGLIDTVAFVGYALFADKLGWLR
ncbi:CPBP family intramembrane metalloprotease [Mycolicibacter terrae]|uniref:CAAX protease n=2 Tax=Mycolicibacter TaxID=1073531 RepID=A0A1A2NL06_MYCSD|nr:MULTISPECIES: CPBP family intramembrane glutamic endopeptidase [Mycolicibacter]OBH15725.1 CAAX protease [Mycolicibacter sinensis]OBI25819.1 CAAX protease [Mycolicibacter sinensis]RRR45361.1 CPBP family intramembrane metalloprotease [Mycolicibacter terrae]